MIQAQLKLRLNTKQEQMCEQWVCGACGAHHERDVNSARNALIAGAGLAHEVSDYAYA
jgi:transposase